MKTLAHEKIVSAIVCLLIFSIVGGIGWALVNARRTPELSIQQQVRDTAINYIKTNHPETAQFLTDPTWTGGRTTSTEILGTETFTYRSLGLKTVIRYPLVEDPIYEINVRYSAINEPKSVLIPYSITWSGSWKNGSITETGYSFAQ